MRACPRCATCTQPDLHRRDDVMPPISLKVTDEDAIDRYSCRFYMDSNNVWILVCNPVTAGGGNGTYQLATVTVTANTTSSSGTAHLGQRPFDPGRRFDTDPNTPQTSFFGNGIPGTEVGAPVPNRDPDYVETRLADSIFTASGLAARPNEPRLSAQEIIACATRPTICGVVFNIRNAAYGLAQLAATQDPNGLTNGQRDAYRHFIGQFLATGHLGQAEAKFWGDLHETSHWANDLSNFMDLWNNAVARGAGASFNMNGFQPGYRLAQTLAQQADNCHQLFYVGPGLVPPETRPSEALIMGGAPGDGGYGCR